LGDQNLKEAGEQEAEEQLEPHAPRELAACEQAAHWQRRVLGEGGEQSDEEKPGVILDYDEAGQLVSLEILDVSRRGSEARKIEFSLAE